jgi:hypothetical protein
VTMLDFLKYVIDQNNGGTALFIVVIALIAGVSTCVQAWLARRNK